MNGLGMLKRNETKRNETKRNITAPFLRLAAARRLKLNTTFVMDNRRT